tara:strand:+ start:565 stop:807 length:243 start_codon:yes stop_codon:yes gene_type:complete
VKGSNNKDNIKSKDWSFTYVNYILFFIGVFTIIAGYLIMYLGETESIQSVKIAPFVLFIGYCVLIPISILYKSRGGSSTG